MRSNVVQLKLAEDEWELVYSASLDAKFVNLWAEVSLENVW